MSWCKHWRWFLALANPTASESNLFRHFRDTEVGPFVLSTASCGSLQGHEVEDGKMAAKYGLATWKLVKVDEATYRDIVRLFCGFGIPETCLLGKRHRIFPNRRLEQEGPPFFFFSE